MENELQAGLIGRRGGAAKGLPVRPQRRGDPRGDGWSEDGWGRAVTGPVLPRNKADRLARRGKYDDIE
jgi:hypothetical protein